MAPSASSTRPRSAQHSTALAAWALRIAPTWGLQLSLRLAMLATFLPTPGRPPLWRTKERLQLNALQSALANAVEQGFAHCEHELLQVGRRHVERLRGQLSS